MRLVRERLLADFALPLRGKDAPKTGVCARSPADKLMRTRLVASWSRCRGRVPRRNWSGRFLQVTTPSATRLCQCRGSLRDRVAQMRGPPQSKAGAKVVPGVPAGSRRANARSPAVKAGAFSNQVVPM
ncbi:hypothetical protein NDU88_007965 [Pleurodeles waltl]|uniref:Uncharacterized protein n=1 Tax=Pleurodeles waltl TaxID=8319 RepID=A0AAV7PUY4_PLEWA|nr:hypothetical protein NDU88_007965 [Pleurodeles waltl]